MFEPPYEQGLALGWFKQSETPPSPPLPAMLLDFPPNHTAFKLHAAAFKKI